MFSRPKPIKARRSNASRNLGKVASKDPEPLWEFDDENDAASIVCQEIGTALIHDPGVNLNSLNSLIGSVEDSMNKSNTVLLILVSICKKVGLPIVAETYLAESDVVAQLFKKLNLDDPQALNMFTSMINILCPEIIKTVQVALQIAMTRSSRRSKATHTQSRVQSALAGFISSGIAEDNETVVASQIANNYRYKPIGFVKTVLDDEDDTINPDDSISRAPRRPTGVSGDKLDERMLRRYSQEHKSRAAEELNMDFPTAKPPVKERGNKGKAGIGFDDMLGLTTDMDSLRVDPKQKKEEDRENQLNQFLNISQKSKASRKAGLEDQLSKDLDQMAHKKTDPDGDTIVSIW
jgi:hypothetical protein